MRYTEDMINNIRSDFASIDESSITYSPSLDSSFKFKMLLVLYSGYIWPIILLGVPTFLEIHWIFGALFFPVWFFGIFLGFNRYNKIYYKLMFDTMGKPYKDYLDNHYKNLPYEYKTNFGKNIKFENYLLKPMTYRLRGLGFNPIDTMQYYEYTNLILIRHNYDINEMIYKNLLLKDKINIIGIVHNSSEDNLDIVSYNNTTEYTIRFCYIIVNYEEMIVKVESDILSFNSHDALYRKMKMTSSNTIYLPKVTEELKENVAKIVIRSIRSIKQ